MAENYEVRATLSARDQNMSSTFDHLYNQSGSLMERLKSGIGFGAMASIGSQAISMLTSAIGDFASSVIEAGSSFEASMSEVSAISGATGAEIDALTEKAKEMGSSTKFTATESSQALKYMAMAGWKTEDMLNGLDGVMNLAAASGEDLATTSDIVTDALTAFGMAAEESSHFADILAAASSNANTNVSMLGESFKYVAPVAGSLGYSAEDVSIALGLMANSGIKASQAGTALRRMLNNMAGNNKEVKVAMNDLGISLTDQSGKMKDLRTVITDLRTAFSGLGEAEKASYASTLAGTTGMSGLLAIVNATDEDFNKLASSIDNCDGTAKRMADTMNDNLAGKMTILGSAMEGLGIAAYDHLSAPFQEAVELITEKIGVLTESMKNGKLGDIMDSIGKGAKNAAKAAGKAFDFIVEHGEQVITVLGGIASAFAAIKAGNALRRIPGLITALIGPLSKMGPLMSSGFSRTTAFLGVLEAGSGPFKSFAASALNAGGGLKGIASAALGCVSPVGAAVTAVGLLAGGLGAWAIANRDLLPGNSEIERQVKKLKNTYSEYAETVKHNQETRQEEIDTSSTEALKAEELADRIETLASKTNKSAAEKAYLKSMIEELNKIIPDLNLQYEEETDKLNQTTDAINNKIEAMKREAEVAAIRAAQDEVSADMADGTREQIKAQEKLGELQDNLAAKQKAYQDAYLEYKQAGKNATTEQQQRMVDTGREWRQAKQAVEEAQGTVDGYTETLKDLENEYGALTAREQQVFNKEHWPEVVAEAESTGIKIPQKLKEGIESGQMMIPASVAELKSLMKWDDLVSEAQKKGIEIPHGLASGIQDGTADPAQAAAYLETILSDKFQGLEAQAAAHGFSIPEKMAEGIQSGAVDPKDAIEYVNQRINEYEPVAEEFLAKGHTIPEAISQGINDGSISVSEATQALRDQIAFEDLAEQASQHGVNVPSYLAEGMLSGALTLEDATDQLMQLAKEHMSNPDAAAASGAQMVEAYNAAIEGGSSSTEAAAAALAQCLGTSLINGSTDASPAGLKAATELAGGLDQGQPQVQTSAKNLTDQAVQGTSNIAGLTENGAKGGDAFATAMGGKTSSALSAADALTQASASGTATAEWMLTDNGVNAGQGFAAGLLAAEDKVRAAAAHLASIAAEASRKALDEHSPSKVFRKIGEFAGQGMAIGIRSMAQDVEKAADQMIAVPEMAIASLDGFTLPDGSFEQSSRDVLIEVPIELDSRIIAKGTAAFVKEELDRRDKISVRLAGG